MPSSNSRHVFSYQTRVGVTADEDKALAEYAALFGRVERTLYADLRKGQEANDLKSEYLDRFGITARQFNAIRAELEGKIEASRVSLLRQIEELRIRIRQARKIIAKLAKRIPGSNELHQKRRRLAGLERRLEQREADRKAGRIGLCFGSKKLFRAQFHLEENGFASHQEWKQAWKEARSKQFFVLGSKDENGGCQGCVASRKEDGSYSLRLRLPNTRAEKEKYVVLSGVRFAYGQRQFEDSLASGRALSYRFLRDKKGWRVLVLTEARPAERISDRRRGALGMDINPDQLVLAEVDRFGNFMGGEHVPCVTYGKTRGQTKALVGDAVKKAIAAAVHSGKPLVVERLEFSKKKAALEGEGARRSRMLSGFAYRLVLQYLMAAAFRAGVEMIQRNPAYTTTMGMVNYAARFGISAHQGAALAIARRGLNLSERPAVRVGQLPTRHGGQVTLLLPARNRSRHVWSFWSKVSRQIRAALRAHVQLLSAVKESTPASRCIQTPCAT